MTPRKRRNFLQDPFDSSQAPHVMNAQMAALSSRLLQNPVIRSTTVQSQHSVPNGSTPNQPLSRKTSTSGPSNGQLESNESTPKRSRIDVHVENRALNFDAFGNFISSTCPTTVQQSQPPRKTAAQALEQFLTSERGKAVFEDAIVKALTSSEVSFKLGESVSNAVPTDLIVQEIRESLEGKLMDIKSSFEQKIEDLQTTVNNLPHSLPENASQGLVHATYSGEDTLVTYAEIEFDSGHKQTLKFLKSEVATIMGAKSETAYVEQILKVYFKTEPQVLTNMYQKVTAKILKKNPLAKNIDPRVKQILIYLIVHKYDSVNKTTIDEGTLKTLKRCAIPHITRALYNLKPKEKKKTQEAAESDSDSTSYSDGEDIGGRRPNGTSNVGGNGNGDNLSSQYSLGHLRTD